MRLTTKRSTIYQTLSLGGAIALSSATLVGLGTRTLIADDYDPTAVAKAAIAKMKVGDKDWPQWGGSPERNNVPATGPTPIEFNVKTGKNIRWSMPLGSETYGNPVIANNKVYVGTNNGNGYIKRYPNTVDLGVLLCFDEKDGKMLWQHSSEKLATGRVHDWPNQGICCAPMIEGDRLWYVTSRGEVVCLDTEGFNDNENDGPFAKEPNENKDEADVVWNLDMMAKLGVSQHNMCSCSVTASGDFLFVNTGNGVDDAHLTVPAEKAPSFICLNKNTGDVLWTDNTPGANVLHGQWSSPAFAKLGGVDQVLFGGGDGYLYSFDANGDGSKAKMLWKFDCNPKDSVYRLNGATRNHIIATPVVYDGLVYVGVGEDPEHGEGHGHLWCIDPTKRGDVSPTQVFNSKDMTTPISPKNKQALVAADGDVERDNANSAAVWHYVGNDPNEFETTMHRTCGTVAIKDNVLYIADFSGMLHCLNAKTGVAYWTHDMLAASWASPLIADGKIYIGDEDGDILILKHEAANKPSKIAEINLGSALYTTPVAANDSIYIANRNRVFAIETGKQSEPVK
jgi:outer membrane protein assembly factor BamB